MGRAVYTLINNDNNFRAKNFNCLYLIQMSIEDLQKNLSEWKKHHAHLIDQFRKLKSSERKNPSKYRRSIQMSRDMTGTVSLLV